MSNVDPTERERFEWEKQNADHQLAREFHRSEDEFYSQTNQAAVSNANVAVRTLLLINGAAALALLTFIGTLIDPEGSRDLSGIIRPLMWFVWGVVAATLAAGMAYLVSFCMGAGSGAREHLWEHPWVKSTNSSERWTCWGNALTVVGIVAAFASLGFFIYGMMEISAAIIEFTSPIEAN